MKILFYRGWCRRNRRLLGFMLLDLAVWAILFAIVYALLSDAPSELLWCLSVGITLTLVAFDCLQYQRNH